MWWSLFSLSSACPGIQPQTDVRPHFPRNPPNSPPPTHPLGSVPSVNIGALETGMVISGAGEGLQEVCFSMGQLQTVLVAVQV